MLPPPLQDVQWSSLMKLFNHQSLIRWDVVIFPVSFLFSGKSFFEAELHNGIQTFPDSNENRQELGSATPPLNNDHSLKSIYSLHAVTLHSPSDTGRTTPLTERVAESESSYDFAQWPCQLLLIYLIRNLYSRSGGTPPLSPIIARI